MSTYALDMHSCSQSPNNYTFPIIIIVIENIQVEDNLSAKLMTHISKFKLILLLSQTCLLFGGFTVILMMRDQTGLDMFLHCNITIQVLIFYALLVIIHYTSPQ